MKELSEKVYQCKLVFDLVVKVEKEPHDRTFANVFEYNFWSEYQDVKGVGEYLAPCEGMSPNGLLLLQRKCKPVNTDKLPKRLPEFLTDLKPENYGLLNGRLVCLDYASTIANPSTKMRSVNWS